jgi:hypothetical protein
MGPSCFGTARSVTGADEEAAARLQRRGGCGCFGSAYLRVVQDECTVGNRGIGRRYQLPWAPGRMFVRLSVVARYREGSKTRSSRSRTAGGDHVRASHGPRIRIWRRWIRSGSLRRSTSSGGHHRQRRASLRRANRGRRACCARNRDDAAENLTARAKGLLVTHGGPFCYCARGGLLCTKSLRRRRRRPDLSEAPFAPRKTTSPRVQ